MPPNNITYMQVFIKQSEKKKTIQNIWQSKLYNLTKTEQNFKMLILNQ